jgi:hypothetical protein
MRAQAHSRPMLFGIAAAALIATSPAVAGFKIRAARIAAGDLWVMGEVDEPNTAVTLDDSFTEKSDSRGRFQFQIPYHPATCAVVLKTARQARAVVIANCGQRGPAGPEGPPAPPRSADLGEPPPVGPSGSKRPEPPFTEKAAFDVSCALKAALYVAPNGFQMWVTRKGSIRPPRSSGASAPQREVVLQVSIGGDVASLRGPDYEAMLRAGPPQEVEAATGQLVNWERLVEGLPGSIQIISDTGPEAVARLTFKECGSSPRRAPPRPSAAEASPSSPETPRASPPAARPLPQGALP